MSYVFVPAIASGERLVSKVGTAPGAKAVELIEAAICRVERRSQAEMPLSDQSGGISRRTHSVGDGAFGEWKPAFDPTGLAGKVVLVSASLLVAAGEHSGSGGTAHGRRDVTGFEDDALGGESIEFGGGDFRRPMEAEVDPPGIVCDHQDHRRWIRRGGLGIGSPIRQESDCESYEYEFPAMHVASLRDKGSDGPFIERRSRASL